MSDPELERDLGRLREGYCRKLPAKIAELESLLRDAREAANEDDPSRDSLEAARRLAHTLKGTSGSYGLDATSAALERLEQALQQILGEPAVGAAAVWADVERAVVGVRERAGPPWVREGP